MYILVFAIIVILFVKYSQLKLHIDFKSFFRRGFKKVDNAFRALLLLWKTAERARHLVACLS